MKKSKNLINKINKLSVEIDRPVNIMEVCGTHTQAISRYGIRQVLPANINLISGPGCPVCVTDQSDIDRIIALAKAGIPVASYGDLIDVPGNQGSLSETKQAGAKVFTIYSVEEALDLKKQEPNLVFFGLGFETTTPMTAYAIKKGLTVYSAHKLFLPAMEHLLKSPKIKIDAYINPGHVSVIVGEKAYARIKAAQVISGFEPEDILQSIWRLLLQIKAGRTQLENEYKRVVSREGNQKARDLIFSVFEPGQGLWRGLGEIPNSGLKIKQEYDNQNAEIKHEKILKNKKFPKNKKLSACRCGDIIQGIIKPKDCPLFKQSCSPENPFGPCMVSSEGACNTAYIHD